MVRRTDQIKETLTKLSEQTAQHPEIMESIEGVVSVQAPLLADIALSLATIADMMAITAETTAESSAGENDNEFNRRQGVWKYIYKSLYKCSVCGTVQTVVEDVDDVRYAYCPFCGARLTRVVYDKDE